MILSPPAHLDMSIYAITRTIFRIKCRKLPFPRTILPTIDLDATDWNILDHLQADARLSNVKLAEAVHLSPSPCLARVRELEAGGFISRYVTLLNPLKIGLTVSVFIQVTLEKQVEKQLQSFEAAIQKRPEVMECYLMTGNSGYLLRVVAPDIQALEGFIVDNLTKIPGIGNIRSRLVLKQVKSRLAPPLPVAPVRRRR